MPTLTQLEYVLAVDKEKHFGRAAESRNVSQPSLSAQVQKVEEELGVTIFDRTKKPILTTREGEKIILQARTILREYKHLFDLIPQDGQILGDFSLGIIPTLSPYILPLFIESFSKTYPLVKLDIHELQTKDIITKLEKDELDGAILVTPLLEKGIQEIPLFNEPFKIYLSKNSLLREKNQISESDLESESVWLLSEGHCFRDQILKICTSQQNMQNLRNVSFQSGSIETLMNLIKRGSGYTLIPDLASRNLSKREYKDHIRHFQDPTPTREVSFVHSRSILKKAIIDALVNEIRLSIPQDLSEDKNTRVIPV